MSVVRYGILLFREPFRQSRLLVIVQIDLIQSSVRKHIEHGLIVIVVYHLAKLIRRDRIGLGTRYKCFLFDRICIHTEIIDPDSDFSFMVAAVHIAVNCKCQIPVIIHTDDPYCMLVILAPHVPAFLI